MNHTLEAKDVVQLLSVCCVYEALGLMPGVKTKTKHPPTPGSKTETTDNYSWPFLIHEV